MILGTASQADHAKLSQHGSDRVQYREIGEVDCNCRASHMASPAGQKSWTCAHWASVKACHVPDHVT